MYVDRFTRICNIREDILGSLHEPICSVALRKHYHVLEAYSIAVEEL
uniref:Uncharacterized protein n=1 Tax=Rhizophora mucronata TaxID=61149 RepID=A0A2P2PHQ4_RHIMU